MIDKLRNTIHEYKDYIKDLELRNNILCKKNEIVDEMEEELENKKKEIKNKNIIMKGYLM